MELIHDDDDDDVNNCDPGNDDGDDGDDVKDVTHNNMFTWRTTMFDQNEISYESFFLIKFFDEYYQTWKVWFWFFNQEIAQKSNVNEISCCGLYIDAFEQKFMYDNGPQHLQY